MEAVKQKIEDIIAGGKEQGATAVKVWYSSGQNRSCFFKNRTLKEIESSDTTSYSITVIKDGREGTSRVSSAEDLNTGLRRALDMTTVGKKVYFSEYPHYDAYPSVKTYSPDAFIPLETLVSENRAFVDGLPEPEYTLHLENKGKANTSEQMIALSNGMSRYYKSTFWNLFGSGSSSREGDVYSIYDFAGSRTGAGGVSMQSIIENCRRLFEMSRRITSIKDGKYPVLFDPFCTSGLGSIINSGVNGRQIYEGASPLKDKLGSRILSKNITIIDNPLIDYDFRASIMDSDGVPTRKFPIIEKGVLKNFTYDLNTASLCSTEPTGHSHCQLNSPLLLPGKNTSNEIIKSIKRGIYVKQFIGFGQGNMINGDFSANLGLGFLIENGEIAGRVKNTMIAGNFYDLAKKNVEVSSDCNPQINLPYLLLDGVKVSAKKQ